MNRRYDDSKIIALHSQGLSDAEIANEIGCTSNQMAKKRKRLGLEPNCMRDTYELTTNEKAIIIGTLLGDGCIRYVHNKCKYPCLIFSHCDKQKEYFLYKTNKLSNIMSSYNSYTKKNYWTKELTTLWQYTGKNMKCLIEIYNAFYINGKKLIPVDYIKDCFTEESIYYWYMDDGCFDKNSKSFIIATECFDKENLLEFIEFLQKKFGLEFTIKKDGELYLKHKCNSIFNKIISKYNNCDTMNYKYMCSPHKTPLNEESPIKDNLVLNPQEIEENA